MSATPPMVIVVLPTFNEHENITRIVPALFALDIP